MKGKSDRTPEDLLNEAFIDTDEFRALDRAETKAREAAKRGEAEVLLPAALMAEVLAVTQPFDLVRLRAVWNRLCDEMGLPEQKQAMPEITVADMATGSKITVRKKPLQYKKAEEEDVDEGPF